MVCAPPLSPCCQSAVTGLRPAAAAALYDTHGSRARRPCVCAHLRGDYGRRWFDTSNARFGWKARRDDTTFASRINRCFPEIMTNGAIFYLM